MSRIASVLLCVAAATVGCGSSAAIVAPSQCAENAKAAPITPPLAIAPNNPSVPKEANAKPAAAPARIEKPKRWNLDEIDAYVTQHIQGGKFVGLSLAIMRDGKIIFAKGYGKSSMETGAAVTPDTAFAIGSITKQFTCAVGLLLAEDKKISLQDKVAKYYPKLERAKDIALLDLMTHQSGYHDYYPLDFVNQEMLSPIEQDTLLTSFAGRKLDFEPRTRWSYSNTGFILAGRIFEKASGKGFDELISQRIFKPAGMTHSFYEPKEGSQQGLADGYTSFFLGDRTKAKREGRGWLGMAGGMYASASDLLKWNLALSDGKIMKPASFEVMTTPPRLADGTPTSYACGIGVSTRQGEKVLGHNGAVSGFLAANTMIPRARSGVVLLSNADESNPWDIQETIFSLLLQEVHQASPPPKVEGQDPRDVARTMIRALQSGTLDKANLGEDFRFYMDDARVAATASRLKALGEPTAIDIQSIRERGGMEVTMLHISFASMGTNAALYRTPDGKIQQFLFLHE